MALSYTLHRNKVSKGADVYRALVTNRQVYTLEMIVDNMVLRHAGISKGEALSNLELFMSEVESILSEGWVVSTPLFYAQCSISGNFKGANDQFYPSRHKIKINMRPGSRLKSITKRIKTHRLNSALPSPLPYTFINASDATRNKKITPGGVGIIHGKKLQFDATDPEQGVFFMSETNMRYKAEEVLRNTFSELYIKIPDNLPDGMYHIEVCSNLKTKTVRMGELSEKLTVGDTASK